MPAPRPRQCPVTPGRDFRGGSVGGGAPPPCPGVRTAGSKRPHGCGNAEKSEIPPMAPQDPTDTNFPFMLSKSPLLPRTVKIDFCVPSRGPLE
eukprot:gene7280-biopygen15072